MLNFLREGVKPQFLNHTNIALIPKVESPQSIHNFRPTSLYNVLYKLIYKVLANRMKQVLEKVISWNQSIFIPGRLITNNIMIAYELLHNMKSRQRGREGNNVIKLDMSKAYNRV